jgi:hypothetical protein
MSGIPDVRLDHRVAGDLRRRDSVAAVVDVEHVTGPDQPYRRRLTSLLEPCSVELDLRPVEVTGAEADVCERDPCRCERRMCDTPPFSRSSRVRTDGVEPPQPLATRLQRAELADARRPRDRAAGRARTDTAGITTPDACRYITAATAPEKGLVGGEPWVPPTEEMEGGIGYPQPEAETLPGRMAPEPAVLPFSSPASVITTPPPPHRLALGAYRPSRTLGPALCAALFRHFLDPPVDGSILRKWRGWDSNPRSRAHEAREDSRSSTARRSLERERRSGRQDSNLRSPTPEVGGVAKLPYDQSTPRAPRQGSNLRHEG